MAGPASRVPARRCSSSSTNASSAASKHSRFKLAAVSSGRMGIRRCTNGPPASIAGVTSCSVMPCSVSPLAMAQVEACTPAYAGSRLEW